MLQSNKASVGAIALALGGVAVMCAAGDPMNVVSPSAKAADKAARKAAKALTKHEADTAIAAAEEAVTLAPTVAGYRMILGQSYLQAGRFRSAGEAFADTLKLDGGNGRAALNLALTQIAGGDWQGARHTLEIHADTISAGDRGLAMALSGDTAGAVALLTQVARSPEASPKVRQNLALAYALGGQWGVARVVAAADMSPADVDARLQQWAAFAQPSGAADQVASLLGVQPVADGGQPTALALNRPAVAPVAVAQAESVPAPAPVVQVAAAPASVPVEVAGPVAAPVQPVVAHAAQAAPVVSVAPAITFAASREVVQPLPVALIERTEAAFKTALKAFPQVKPAPLRAAFASAKTFTPTAGSWHVQLGAFENAGVAKDAWSRATRRFAAFKGHTPQGATFRTAAASFYRLSVGGFSRATADQACRQYRARGGVCFVRQSAGDQIASWVKPGERLAVVTRKAKSA